ncbi:hypothetical protein J6590_100089 [Homalodisca vitripennis]|nr:hypothetical protein J6590_100089 [Homalodisca vitripennis]
MEEIPNDEDENIGGVAQKNIDSEVDNIELDNLIESVTDTMGDKFVLVSDDLTEGIPDDQTNAQDDLYDMNESNEDVNTPDVTIDDYVLNEDFIDNNVSMEAVNSEEFGENEVIVIVLPYNAHVETNESGERLENNESVEVTGNEHRQTYEEISDKSSVGLSVDNNDGTDLNVNQETTINHVTVSNVVSEYTEENIVANPEENNDHTDNPNEDRDINNIAEPKNRSRKRITTPEDWVRNVRKKASSWRGICKPKG